MSEVDGVCDVRLLKDKKEQQSDYSCGRHVARRRRRPREQKKTALALSPYYLSLSLCTSCLPLSRRLVRCKLELI